MQSQETQRKQKVQDDPLEPMRVRAFAHFFKRYMSLSALVVAALPIPVTAFELIPTFAVHKKILSVYVSLFCFLILAFIFFSRHRLARLMFSEYCLRQSIKSTRKIIISKLKIFIINALPILMIITSLACLLGYHYILERHLGYAVKFSSPQSIILERGRILSETIPGSLDSILLIGLYLGIFITAEAAFVLMAIKEYLQDLLGLSDIEIIQGRTDKKSSTERSEDFHKSQGTH